MDASSQTAARFSSTGRTLVIMAKAPKPGMVKTRLIQSLPSPAVTALYRCLLEDTVALAKSLPGVQVAVMCREQDKEELAGLLGDTVEIVAQKGEGLAAGLISVFRYFSTPPRQHRARRGPRDSAPGDARSEAKTGPQHVIAFNSDSPHLAPSVLESAFAILAAHDVVVGPTHDGGYYLVGAKAAHPTLFENDGLGTSSALERLLARTKALELATGFTEPFYDIDVADDLIKLAQELQLAPAKAPRTAAWFGDWEQAVAHLRESLAKL